MELNYDILPLLIGSSVIMFTIYITLYYKYIYSLVDPLFLWVFTTAFASILAIQVIPDLQDVFHFFGCQLALWFGFLIAYSEYNRTRAHVDKSDLEYNYVDIVSLRNTTYVLLIMYIFSNIIIAYTRGFALFSDLPSEAKIANFQNGFGLFRKINWSTGTFVNIALVFLYLKEKKRADIFYLLIVVFFTSLDGSKAAFLKIAASAGIVFYHPAFADKKDILNRFQKYLPLFFVVAIAIVFIILLKENSGADEAFLAFIRRLLYSADSILYYYTPVNIDYFSKYSIGDYISRITNPVLGFFRIQPYEEVPGNIMVDNLRSPGSSGFVTVGPNSPFYIEGRIYFNFWVAFPYSMMIGYFYARVRTYFFSLINTSAFFFIYVGSILQLAIAIIIDTNLAVVQFFDLVYFVFIPHIIVTFFVKRKIKVKVSSSTMNFFRKIQHKQWH